MIEPEVRAINIYDLTLQIKVLKKNNLTHPSGVFHYYYQTFEQLPIEIQTEMFQNPGKCQSQGFSWRGILFICEPTVKLGFGFPAGCRTVAILDKALKPTVKQKAEKAIMAVRNKFFWNRGNKRGR